MIADVIRRLLPWLLGCLLVAAACAVGAVYWLLSGDGIRLALEQQASTHLGTPVHIGSVTAQFYPRIGVHMDSVTIGDPTSITLASVALSTGLRNLLSRRIDDAEVAIADSRLELPLPVALKINPVDFPDTSPASSGLTVGSIRDISLRNVTFASRGRDVTVSARSSLAGGTLTLSSMSVTAAGTTITAGGTITLAPVIDAAITASAARLNLDDLVALAAAFAPPSAPNQSAAAPQAFTGRITAQISAEQATAAGLEMQGLTTVVRVIGSRLSLSPTQFRVFGGRYDGDVDVDLRDDTSMKITSHFTALDAAQLAAFGGAEGSITGRLTANGTVTGRGNDFSSILASARGMGNITVTDGSIHRLDLVRTVIVFFGRPATASPPTTDKFSRIDSRISIGNGVVSADAFSLRSPDADMVGQGTIALDTKAIDGRVDLSLSEDLSKEAGTDLARYTRDGNRIVLPARLGGTLGNPRLSIDAASAVKRGLRNELDRRMRGLLDRFKTP